MKKLCSILLVMALVLGMTTTAFASSNSTQTVTQVENNTGHVYHAHQIFSGTQAVGEAMLGSIEWGSGVNATEAMLNEIKEITKADGRKPFKDCTTAESVANILANSAPAGTYGYNTEEALLFAKVVAKYLKDTEYVVIGATATSSIEIPAGYYLLEDTAVTENTNDVTGLSLLQITGDKIRINSKTNKPTVEKKVQDEPADKDKASKDDVYGWGETADHAINESFKFELEAVVPNDVALSMYEKYKIEFYDTMSEGVTFESIESVYINEVEVPVYSESNPNGYKLSANALNGAAGITWTLTIEDIKPYLSSVQSAAIEGAVVIEVVYNAHLNENAVIGNVDENENTVYLKYSNNPNAEGSGELGQTSEDTVWVFTYRILATKFKNAIQEVNKLEGAGFTLYTAAEYQKYIDNDSTTIATPVALLNGNDGYHYPAPADAEGAVTEIMTMADGDFSVKGLDTGIYYLVETTVPAGYNKCADVKVEITAVHEETSATTAKTQISMKENDVIASDLKIDVVNNQGATLPETGGIGTTIFYVVGAVLVLGAVVLLVAKRRMNSEE